MQYPEGWTEVAGALERDYRLAISWSVVKVRWRTHRTGAITERDIEMARHTDELAQ